MTEHPPHMKAVQRIKDMLQTARATIRENDDEETETERDFQEEEEFEDEF